VIPAPDVIVVAALMLLGVFSLRQLIEADLRSARRRRKALKGLARKQGGRYTLVRRGLPSGERVDLLRHGREFRVFYEVVMAADDASSYTRVQLRKPEEGRSFPSLTIVPEDFLERADNVLFGREDRDLGDADLDRRVIVRAEPGRSLDAARSQEVLQALRVFLEAGDWDHDFLLESVPDLLRVSHNSHLEDPEELDRFVSAATDLLAAFPELAELSAEDEEEA
jgi:hypothetical protein